MIMNQLSFKTSCECYKRSKRYSKLDDIDLYRIDLDDNILPEADELVDKFQKDIVKERTATRKKDLRVELNA